MAGPASLARRWLRRAAWRRRVDPEHLRLIRASGLFSPAWYAAAHPELAGYPLPPLAHFAEYGLAEGRDPGPRFSTSAYLRRRPDVPEPGVPPFIEAMRRGPAVAHLWSPEDGETLRAPLAESGLFDAEWYRRRYPDVARGGGDPLAHYLRHGAHESRSPGPAFDAEAYAEDHPGYAALFDAPIFHYLLYGRARGYAARGEPDYRTWLARHDALTDEDSARIRLEAAREPLPPVLIVALSGADDAIHREAVRASWRAQLGTGWIARVVGGTAERADDPRIRAVPDVEAALAEIAPDAVVVVVAGPVLLAPHAVYALARTLAASGADAAYADHDSIRGGERDEPRFKPAMSPEYLRNHPYVGPLLAVRASAAGAVLGRLRAGRADAQTVAAAMAALDPRRVRHCPFVLAHLPGPAEEGASPPIAPPAVTADVLPTVSIVIPTRDRGELLEACIASLRGDTDYPAGKVEIVVVDNDTTDPATLALLARLRDAPGTIVVPSPGPFNFSRVTNAGAARAEGEILVLLNNDTTVARPDWLRRLVGYATQPDIGVVGAMLLYPDGTIQHGGVVLGYEGVAVHRDVGLRPEDLPADAVTREMTAMTGACLAVRRGLYARLGGLDEALEVAFNDVALCAASLRAGHRNVFVAEPLLHHHESKSRGAEATPAKARRDLREGAYAARLFGDLFRNDPSYSPNLALRGAIGGLADPPRVVRPWRRTRFGPRRVLLLGPGSGDETATVIWLQAEALRRRGFQVEIGAPSGGAVVADGLVRLETARQAAAHAVGEGIDAVVVHGPPFLALPRLLGASPLSYLVEGGATRPSDRDETRRSAAYATRVLALTRAARARQHRADAILLGVGNTHGPLWDDAWARRRPEIRRALGLGDRFVVLGAGSPGDPDAPEPLLDVAAEFGLLFPGSRERIVFVHLPPSGDPLLVALDDVRHLRSVGPDEIRAAADLYLDLGIGPGGELALGRALAMGLPALVPAGAEREFEAETTRGVLETCEHLAREIERTPADPVAREALVRPWDASLERFCTILEADIAAAPSPWLAATRG